MSSWRKRAIEVLPERKKELEDPDLSVYSVFTEMLTALEEACKANDTEKIANIYDYAGWCHTQKDQKLWNAAGVSFYEHLADEDAVFASFKTYVSKEIFASIRNLIAHRFDDKKIKALDDYYRSKKS